MHLLAPQKVALFLQIEHFLGSLNIFTDLYLLRVVNIACLLLFACYCVCCFILNSFHVFSVGIIWDRYGVNLGSIWDPLLRI